MTAAAPEEAQLWAPWDSWHYVYRRSPARWAATDHAFLAFVAAFALRLDDPRQSGGKFRESKGGIGGKRGAQRALSRNRSPLRPICKF